ncbi:MAG: glucokinase [Xanthobacteraceae bacterium]|nr:glucokinase [Xanthobacteraceae bacterium]
MAELVLVGDIGGTNARFALASRGSLSCVHSSKAAEHSGVLEAATRFLTRECEAANLEGVALGVAGPVRNGRSTITNTGWTVDRKALQSHLNCQAVYLLNDFEALAWSLPHLSASHVVQLHAGKAVADAPQLVVGPGTGFGAACLVRDDGRFVAVTGEAGHSTCPAASASDEEIVGRLRKRFDHVSIERVLSGPGLQNLYGALAEIAGTDVPSRRASEIAEAGLQGTCETCSRALDAFCEMLGTVAGNLALTFGAVGGVYIAGGIVPRILPRLQQSGFEDRFLAKGRYRNYVQNIPVHVILHPQASLVGLAAYFDAQRRAAKAEARTESSTSGPSPKA